MPVLIGETHNKQRVTAQNDGMAGPSGRRSTSGSPSEEPIIMLESLLTCCRTTPEITEVLCGQQLGMVPDSCPPHSATLPGAHLKHSAGQHLMRKRVALSHLAKQAAPEDSHSNAHPFANGQKMMRGKPQCLPHFNSGEKRLPVLFKGIKQEHCLSVTISIITVIASMMMVTDRKAQKAHTGQRQPAVAKGPASMGLGLMPLLPVCYETTLGFTGHVLFALNQTLLQHESVRAGSLQAPYTTEDLIKHYNCGDLNAVIFNHDTSQTIVLLLFFYFAAKSDPIPQPKKLPNFINTTLPPHEQVTAQEIDSYFRQELIYKRNERMGKRVMALLQENEDKICFFAFGAGQGSDLCLVQEDFHGSFKPQVATLSRDMTKATGALAREEGFHAPRPTAHDPFSPSPPSAVCGASADEMEHVFLQSAGQKTAGSHFLGNNTVIDVLRQAGLEVDHTPAGQAIDSPPARSSAPPPEETSASPAPATPAAAIPEAPSVTPTATPEEEDPALSPHLLLPDSLSQLEEFGRQKKWHKRQNKHQRPRQFNDLWVRIEDSTTASPPPLALQPTPSSGTAKPPLQLSDQLQQQDPPGPASSSAPTLGLLAAVAATIAAPFLLHTLGPS
ncbi:UPF0632 protein A [Heterocephalus glaber]|uniref:Metalloprotease TIKI n=1 Tax=Heterocephalus glaber TaxID=10181 RepID=G5BI90_HETGA|nr:UPF0632 protein A [Heterocephalus glaber]